MDQGRIGFAVYNETPIPYNPAYICLNTFIPTKNIKERQESSFQRA